VVRVLALDLGERRVGVAVSDATGTLASPRATLIRSGDRAADHRAVARLVAEEEVELVVVGWPRNMDGSEGPAARAAAAEAAVLAGLLGVPVELSDERLSTVSAARALQAAGHDSRAQRLTIDQAAAAVILQAWLDGRRRPGPGKF